ncbi:MAG: hypothetical protein HKN26_00540 [Acidimicrobiales bacterium]|nr:hypothetical protein [Acidimicrobiales bacterium]
MDVRGIVAELFAPSSSRVGIEAEFFTGLPDGSRPSFDLLTPLVTEVMPAGGTITLEPGSQIEVSTAPHGTAAAAATALRADVAALIARLDGLGIAARGAAIDTDRPPERTTGEERYRHLEQELDRFSPAGRWMMTNTCALQINVGGGQLTGQTWRVLNRVGPLLTAAFANSPGVDAQGRWWQSLRQGCWLSMDPRRAAPPLARTGDRVDDYLAYALAAPRLFPEPDGLVFGEWLHGAAEPRPARADFVRHLSTLFPPVRPRGWFEIRSIDMVPVDVIEVVALTVATLVEPDVVAEVDRVVQTVPTAETAAMHGLRAPDCQRAAAALFAILAQHDSSGQIGSFADDYVHQGRCPGATRPDEAQMLMPPLSA